MSNYPLLGMLEYEGGQIWSDWPAYLMNISEFFLVDWCYFVTTLCGICGRRSAVKLSKTQRKYFQRIGNKRYFVILNRTAYFKAKVKVYPLDLTDWTTASNKETS